MVRTIVLNQLSMAPRSRAQLETKLAAKDAPVDVVARVLDRFEAVGLVDDTAFAQALVRSKQASRGLSGRALRHELRLTGVDDDVAEAALAEIDPEVELATAQALIARKLGPTRGLPYAKRVNRLVSLLARKGYPSSIALQVVREAIADDNPGE